MIRVVLMMILFFSPSIAHQIRENYLRIDDNATRNLLRIQLEIETRLYETPQIDDNGNGIVSYKELRHHMPGIFADIQRHIHFYGGVTPLSLKGADLQLHRYQDQTYLTITKAFHGVEAKDLTLYYDLFFDQENNHKLIIHQKGGHDAVLDNRHREYSFSTGRKTLVERFKNFLRLGFFHILEGLDHLLFILMILLPSVHRGLGRSWLEILKIVTAFTVAHSMTLFLAGADLFRPDPVLIESGIALSIAVVAFLNLLGSYRHVDVKIVFAFGLLHGFGFADVLHIAGIEDTAAFLTALLGFNLGVEAGQLAVIAIYLPLLYLVGKVSWKEYGIRWIALVTLFVALYWFFERIGLLS